MKRHHYFQYYHYVLVLLLSSLLFSASVIADVYKWVDDKGLVHYGDQPKEGAKSEKVEAKINSLPSPIRTSNDREFASSSKKVVMYSTSWCGYCKKARKYFESRGIAFVEYDIEKNSRAKREYDRIGGKGVPVILVGKKRMNGFSEAGFDRLYDL